MSTTTNKIRREGSFACESRQMLSAAAALQSPASLAGAGTSGLPSLPSSNPSNSSMFSIMASRTVDGEASTLRFMTGDDEPTIVGDPNAFMTTVDRTGNGISVRISSGSGALPSSTGTMLPMTGAGSTPSSTPAADDLATDIDDLMADLDEDLESDSAPSLISDDDDATAPLLDSDSAIATDDLETGTGSAIDADDLASDLDDLADGLDSDSTEVLEELIEELDADELMDLADLLDELDIDSTSASDTTAATDLDDDLVTTSDDLDDDLVTTSDDLDDDLATASDDLDSTTSGLPTSLDDLAGGLDEDATSVLEDLTSELDSDSASDLADLLDDAGAGTPGATSTLDDLDTTSATDTTSTMTADDLLAEMIAGMSTPGIATELADLAGAGAAGSEDVLDDLVSELDPSSASDLSSLLAGLDDDSETDSLTPSADDDSTAPVIDSATMLDEMMVLEDDDTASELPATTPTALEDLTEMTDAVSAADRTAALAEIAGMMAADPAAGSAPATASQSSQVARFSDLVNNLRASNGLPPLTLDPTLNAQAAQHNRTQIADGAISHKGFKTGRGTAAQNAIPGATRASENVAFNRGFSDPVLNAFNRLVESPGHLRNMLGTYPQGATGVAITNAPDGSFYFTQLFVG